MNERFVHVRASLLLARRAVERQLGLVAMKQAPDADAFAEVAAHLDDALKALDALERLEPFRVLPGGKDRGEH
jgi:hypothetical protein